MTRNLLLLGVFLCGTTALASKCLSPQNGLWYPSMSPQSDHFEFSYDWNDPEQAKKRIVFQDPKTGKEVVVIQKAGLFIDGKKACSYQPYSMAGCPKDLPVKCEDENSFQVESSGVHNGKVTMTYRGSKLEAVFPEGIECTLFGAEASAKKRVEEMLKDRGLAKFLDSAIGCLNGKDMKCRSRFLSPQVREQLKSEPAAASSLATLLKHRSYPEVGHGAEEAPREGCAQLKPDLTKASIVPSTCEYVSLSSDKGSWIVTEYVL